MRRGDRERGGKECEEKTEGTKGEDRNWFLKSQNYGLPTACV